MRNCIPLLLVTLVFAAIAPASCGGTVEEGNPDQSTGGTDGGVESGPPSKGGSAGLPGAGGAAPGGGGFGGEAPACPINEPYQGESCNPYQGAPCVYSRPHCEHSPWACPAGQWVFNGSAGAIALGCPEWKELPPEGERCDCNGHHWQEWTDAPCWFPGGCATCEGDHWHHVDCWYDAGPEASFPPDAAPDALWD